MAPIAPPALPALLSIIIQSPSHLTANLQEPGLIEYNTATVCETEKGREMTTVTSLYLSPEIKLFFGLGRGRTKRESGHWAYLCQLPGRVYDVHAAFLCRAP